MRGSRSLLVPLATMVVAGAVALGSGATWTSSTEIETNVTAGELIVDTADGKTVLGLTGLVPGGEATGTMSLENQGDVDATLKLSESDVSHALAVGQSGTFDPAMLTLKIEVDGVTVYGPAAIGAMATPIDLGKLTADDGAPGGGDDLSVSFTVKLDSRAGNAYQAASAGATYTFLATQGVDPQPAGDVEWTAATP